MNICMVGTGYVGLVTGACLADFGMNVVCVDKDAEKIANLQAGHVPIYEPGLEEVISRNERVITMARVLSPLPTPSPMPTAIANTFFNAPAISTPTTSDEE